MRVVKIGAMWCPACIVTNKFWKEIKDDFSDIEFVDLDIDMDDEESNKFGNLDILPVVVFEEKNKELKRIIGEHKKDEYENTIKELLK